LENLRLQTFALLCGKKATAKKSKKRVFGDPRSHTVPSTFKPSQSFFKNAKKETVTVRSNHIDFNFTFGKLAVKNLCAPSRSLRKKATAKKSKKGVGVEPRSHTVPSTFKPSQSFFKDAKKETQAFE
jgi:hypothetical protein